jgi:hypothetical protein
LIAERFGQELDRSSLYRLSGHRDVAVSGDEDDRNVNARRRQLSLKIETTSARQPDVEHTASGRPSFRNSGTEARALACTPTDRIRLLSASRILGSSSTMIMVGCSVISNARCDRGTATSG